MAGISFHEVTKRFGDVVAVDDLTLDIEDRELLVLLGPSGCGKSTALRMIAGLDEPTSGTVCIGEEVVNGVDPGDRDIAMALQSYAVCPHMTGCKTIEAALLSRHVSVDGGTPRRLDAAERRSRVVETAATLDLGDYLDRKPAALSGGQRQRVALARAIVRRPRVFLMDEPLSNLDAKLRTQTRLELVELWRRLETTFVYVTHDQVEAMTMASRIAILVEGRLQQVGRPQEVYQRPANLFVARFIGSPPMNTLDATVGQVGEGYVARVGDVALPLPPDVPVSADQRIVVGVRPEHLRIDADGPLDAVVRNVEMLGHEQHVICEVANQLLIVRASSDVPIVEVGTSMRLRPDSGQLHIFDAENGGRLA